MEMMNPNNCCDLCRIPHQLLNSYQDLVVSASKRMNDPDLMASDAEGDDVEPSFTSAKPH